MTLGGYPGSPRIQPPRRTAPRSGPYHSVPSAVVTCGFDIWRRSGRLLGGSRGSSPLHERSPLMKRTISWRQWRPV